MDRFDHTLLEGVLNLYDSHEQNQGLRAFLWDTYQAKRQDFPSAFIKSVGALSPLLRRQPDATGTHDPFLMLRGSIERADSVGSTLAWALCRSLGDPSPCSNLPRYLGSLDQKILDQWTNNSPTAIGTQGRAITVNGKPATIRFLLVDDPDSEDGKVWTATLEQDLRQAMFRGPTDPLSGPDNSMVMMAVSPLQRAARWTLRGQWEN